MPPKRKSPAKPKARAKPKPPPKSTRSTRSSRQPPRSTRSGGSPSTQTQQDDEASEGDGEDDEEYLPQSKKAKTPNATHAASDDESSPATLAMPARRQRVKMSSVRGGKIGQPDSISLEGRAMIAGLMALTDLMGHQIKLTEARMKHDDVPFTPWQETSWTRALAKLTVDGDDDARQVEPEDPDVTMVEED